jgi:hypothetical protein
MNELRLCDGLTLDKANSFRQKILREENALRKFNPFGGNYSGVVVRPTLILGCDVDGTYQKTQYGVFVVLKEGAE